MHAVTGSNGEIKEQIPTQVVRLLSKKIFLDDAAKGDLKQQNTDWQKAFQKVDANSIWQYYQLVGTQWMENPNIVNQKIPSEDPPISKRDWLTSRIKQEEIRPGTLLNVSLEAYAQNQTNGDSCIACHVTAKLPSSSGKSEKVMSDFSFLLERAKTSSDR